CKHSVPLCLAGETHGCPSDNLALVIRQRLLPFFWLLSPGRCRRAVPLRFSRRDIGVSIRYSGIGNQEESCS
ncbi:hypothetical protein TorRG33x02_118410, partial [Trema orientale]